MAVPDEDWKHFLDSTKEEPEEVETDEEDEPEDPKKAAKSDQDDPDEKDEDDPDEEDDSKQDDDSKKDDPSNKKTGDDTYKPRLKQFLNDDGSLKAKEIEDAYVESGKRAVTLDKQVKDLTEQFEGMRTDYGALLDAIKAKPDIAKALFGEEGAKKLANSQPASAQPAKQTDPLLQHLSAQMTRQSRTAYDEFVKAHPEAATDPEKARLIGEFLEIHGATYRKQHDGEIPSMKESLEAAYRYYGWDLEVEKKESVATAAKNAAATRSSGTAKRSATKKETTLSEEFFAKKLGVKLK